MFKKLFIVFTFCIWLTQRERPAAEEVTSSELLIPDSVAALTVALGRVTVRLLLLKCVFSVASCSEGNSLEFPCSIILSLVEEKNVELLVYYPLSFVSLCCVETTDRKLLAF